MATRRVLVVEGGGMKASFANGVLSAFEEAQVPAWHAVVGTSAGGALAAWYSAGQSRYAEHTWRYAEDPRIVNLRRALLMQGPFMDHEKLFDVVYRHEHPLDVEALAKAPWPVIVTVADIHKGTCEYPDIRQGDAIEWLKATGRLPFGSGGPVVVAGRAYIDGGTLDPIPVKYAVEQLGAREVVLIKNQPPGPVRPDPRLLLELAGRRLPRLKHGIVNHHRYKEEAMEYAANPPPGVKVRTIHPGQHTGLTRFSRDMERVYEVLEQGRAAGRALVADFNGSGDVTPEALAVASPGRSR